MPEIMEEWREYKAKKTNSPRMKRIRFINEKAEEAYEGETKEMKALVGKVVAGEIKIGDLDASPEERRLREVRERLRYVPSF